MRPDLNRIGCASHAGTFMPHGLATSFGLAEEKVIKVEPLITARGLPSPFDYSRPDGCDVGSVVEVQFGRQKLRGVVTGLAESSQHKLKQPMAVAPERLLPQLVRMALWMADDIVSTPARCLELLLPPEGVAEKTRFWAEVDPLAQVREPGQPVQPTPSDPGAEFGFEPGTRLTQGQVQALRRLPNWAGEDLSTLRRLESRNLVLIEARTQGRRPQQHQHGTPAPEPVLNPDQALAVQRLAESPPGDRFLLYGVTGSGKTEVYLQAAQRTLNQGKNVLLLVPEIGLTPQAAQRFQSRFGETVAVLHSGLSKGERRDEWWRLANGEARVCVGPMSAVFAPLDNLGLVIVDEEHDPAFKQDSDPRYDARRLAAWRANDSGAVLLCGSATPRPESWQSLKRISLPKRADGRQLPTVRLVDMRKVKEPLHTLVHQALVDSRKSVVLLNRRGWARWLECADCGHGWECPNCDVSLVLHGVSENETNVQRGTLRCHHCGHQERPPKHCPSCASASVGRHGIGTERLMEHLPGHVYRVDGDVKDPAAVISRFHQSDHGILLGTQMIAKGHDFPDVDLGVVIDADATLRFPDFRSQERTFQLVSQLAGRAGRGGTNTGRVLVQTLLPEDESLLYAARHDAVGFLAGELARRKKLDYPPFSTLLRVTLEHELEERASRAALDLRALLPDEALGPVPIFRRQARYRQQIELKASHRNQGVAIIRNAVNHIVATPAHRGVAIAVEVDPR